jgi:lipopolysaccharide/colanic/teichoic acid biosynthesis glycosyltransferase
MYLVFKRITDIIIALTALTLLSPLFVIVIILLLLTGEREVFYLQQRIGYRGRSFHIWKFATMLKNSPNMGTAEITLRNDPRVTMIGKWLRKSKVNELPQIINVLKGEMSIVGPRPLMKVSYDLYTKEQQERIYSRKPGITGIGSLIFRDEEKLLSASSNPRETYQKIYPYKASVEIWYAEHASLANDLLIIVLTAYTVLFPENHLLKKCFRDLPERTGF